MKTKILVCKRENNIRTRVTLKRDKIIEQEDDIKFFEIILNTEF